MRLSLLCAVALLAIVGPMYVEAFRVPDMTFLKEKMKELNKMKDDAIRRWKGERDAGTVSKDIAETLHEKIKSITGMKVKDPKALKEAIRHLMYLHADKSLDTHTSMMATSDKLIEMLKKTMKSKGIALPKLNETKLKYDLTSYQRDSIEEIKNAFSKLIKGHGIHLEYAKLNEIVKQFYKSFENKKWHTIMDTFTKHYTKPLDAPFKETIRASMIAAAAQIRNKLVQNMEKILESHSIMLPAGTIEKSLAAMNANMLAHYFEKRISVEMRLSEYFNQVMDLMVKAFGDKDHEDLVKILEKVQSMLPHVMETKIKEMMMHLKKNGKKMCMETFLETLVIRLQPPQKHEEKKHHRHHHRHHHHHHPRMLYVKIFAPIGGVILLVAIAVGIYCFLKRKKRSADDFDDIQKPPSKKTNPYNHLEETHSVSKA